MDQQGSDSVDQSTHLHPYLGGSNRKGGGDVFVRSRRKKVLVPCKMCGSGGTCLGKSSRVTTLQRLGQGLPRRWAPKAQQHRRPGHTEASLGPLRASLGTPRDQPGATEGPVQGHRGATPGTLRDQPRTTEGLAWGHRGASLGPPRDQPGATERLAQGH